MSACDEIDWFRRFPNGGTGYVRPDGTTDSPKSPGSTARPACNCGPCQREAAERSAPIPYLRRHVAEAIYDGLGIYNRPDADRAANLVVEMLRPELERLAFERDFAQANLNEYIQQLQDLRDDYLTGEPVPVTEVVSATKREVERLTAEVERLREQRGLAEHAASMRLDLLQEVDRLLRPMLGNVAPDDEWFPDDLARYAAGLVAKERAEVSRLREQLAAQQPADLVERAALWLFRAKTSRLMPDVLQRASMTWRQVLDQQDRNAWVSYAREMLADLGWTQIERSASSEASPIIHSVLLSSDTGVMGEWQAFCVGCEQRFKGDLPKAEFWKDQHLADTMTLTPVQALDALSRQSQEFGCVRVDLVSSWKKGDKALYKVQPDDEGEECQIVAVAGDTAIVEADPFPFGNPQRWSADVSELHPLPPREPSCEEVVPEGHEDASLCGRDVVPGSDRCADHGGRPSGSERLAPRPRPAFVENALAGLLQDLYGFIPLSVRYGAAQAARAAVEEWATTPDHDQTEGVCGECHCALPFHKTWCNSIDGPQDAAQAARSEATPKFCQYVTRRANNPDWVCLLPFGHGDDHEVGPPSLRREGEDSA